MPDILNADRDLLHIRELSKTYQKALYQVLEEQLIVEYQVSSVFESFKADLQSEGQAQIGQKPAYEDYVQKLANLKLLSNLIHSLGLTNYAEPIMSNEINRLFPSQANPSGAVQNRQRPVPAPVVADVEAGSDV